MSCPFPHIQILATYFLHLDVQCSFHMVSVGAAWTNGEIPSLLNTLFEVPCPPYSDHTALGVTSLEVLLCFLSYYSSSVSTDGLQKWQKNGGRKIMCQLLLLLARRNQFYSKCDQSTGSSITWKLLKMTIYGPLCGIY